MSLLKERVDDALCKYTRVHWTRFRVRRSSNIHSWEKPFSRRRRCLVTYRAAVIQRVST
jgi:hypothetical protein